MKNLISKDAISTTERLKGLCCRPVWAIKKYEKYYREINNKKMLIKKNIKKG